MPKTSEGSYIIKRNKVEKQLKAIQEGGGNFLAMYQALCEAYGVVVDAIGGDPSLSIATNSEIRKHVDKLRLSIEYDERLYKSLLATGQWRTPIIADA